MADIKELIEYRKLYYKADRYARQVEDLRAKLYAVKLTNFQREHVDGGLPSERQEVIIDKLREVEESLVDTLTALHNQMATIEAKVDRLPYPYNEVLMRYYCRFDTFERIAVDLHYNYRWVQRLHQKGLQKYKEAV